MPRVYSASSWFWISVSLLVRFFFPSNLRKILHDRVGSLQMFNTSQRNSDETLLTPSPPLNTGGDIVKFSITLSFSDTRPTTLWGIYLVCYSGIQTNNIYLEAHKAREVKKLRRQFLEHKWSWTHDLKTLLLTHLICSTLRISDTMTGYWLVILQSIWSVILTWSCSKYS